MRLLTPLCALTAVTSALTIQHGDDYSSDTGKLAPALYDGTNKCIYPVPDPKFRLKEYLGTWYQVAGTPFGRTSGARCVTATYGSNPNGTVSVQNTGIVGSRSIGANGTATPVDPKVYGKGGAFIVQFPMGSDSECPGPNYIVQEYGKEYAIVQTANWGVLYILSREQMPKERKVQRWIERAVELGSNATAISLYDQKDC